MKSTSFHIAAIALTLSLAGCVSTDSSVGGAYLAGNTSGNVSGNGSNSSNTPIGIFSGSYRSGSSDLNALVTPGGYSLMSSMYDGVYYFGQYSTYTNGSISSAMRRYVVSSSNYFSDTATIADQAAFDGNYITGKHLAGTLVSQGQALPFTLPSIKTVNFNDMPGSYSNTDNSLSPPQAMTLIIASAGQITSDNTNGCKFTGNLFQNVAGFNLFDLEGTMTCNGTAESARGTIVVDANRAIQVSMITASKLTYAFLNRN